MHLQYTNVTADTNQCNQILEQVANRRLIQTHPKFQLVLSIRKSNCFWVRELFLSPYGLFSWCYTKFHMKYVCKTYSFDQILFYHIERKKERAWLSAMVNVLSNMA